MRALHLIRILRVKTRFYRITDQEVEIQNIKGNPIATGTLHGMEFQGDINFEKALRIAIAENSTGKVELTFDENAKCIASKIVVRVAKQPTIQIDGQEELKL